MIKTMNQIIADGHKIISDSGETFKTQIGLYMVIWQRLSEHKFRRLEQYRIGLSI